MPARPSNLRFLLIALTCVSFAGLSLGQGRGRICPARVTAQVFEEIPEESPFFLAAVAQEMAAGMETPVRSEFTSVAFGVDKGITVLPPAFAVLMEIGHGLPSIGSAEADYMRNKDPPARTGQT